MFYILCIPSNPIIGVKLWAEFDKKYFLLPLAQREKAILDNKRQIIEGLNKHFQKVYFGRKATGEVVDLQVFLFAQILEFNLTICTGHDLLRGAVANDRLNVHSWHQPMDPQLVC